MIPAIPGLFSYPGVAGVEEIYQLTAEDQQQLLQESSYVSEKLKDILCCEIK